MKKIYLFIISLIIFSFWIYFFKNYFLWNFETDLNNHIENTYIEPNIINEELTSWTGIIKDDNNRDNINNNFIDDIEKKVSFLYFPSNFNLEILNHTNAFKSFLFSFIIKDKIDFLKVEMHQDKPWIRWNMKDHSIKLFWVNQMSEIESTAVWIHEFWHFIDLYFFKKQVFTDISNYFYNISWYSDKVIKPGQTWYDFVSWYAMTNEYEDFAESFAYFVLHNNDFKEKSIKSKSLKKKYDFFSHFLFRKQEFEKTNFSWEKIKPYYRDITKINFSLQNFLEFLKK